MRGLKIVLYSLAGVILTAVLVSSFIWRGELKTISTVRQVGDNKYLYQMEYKATYDLDELIASDIDSNSKLLEYVVKKIGKGLSMTIKAPHMPSSGDDDKQGFNCTSFQAKNADGDGFWFGRNYDFFKNPTMVTVSRPENGYASIAVSDMSHFGYGLEKLPTSFLSKLLCLASVYVPMDGINEKGVCTSIMALPNQPSRQRTGKHVVGTTVIMRLILDRCSSVEEAVNLVNSLDIRHDVDAGSGYHYMVSDSKGDCVVIEFDKNDGWKTIIVRKDAGKNSMLVTNHLLNPKYFTTEPDPEVGNPHSRSWWRYETAGAYLDGHDGTLSLAQAQKCLSQVHWKDLIWDNGMVEDTQYSNVYDQTGIKLFLRNWNEYERTYRFSLSEDAANGAAFPLISQEGRVAVVAHRGFWKCEAAAGSQNSIASLNQAQINGFWGSECDIYLTSDGEIIVNHDKSIDGLAISEHSYAELGSHLLANGEHRPTFDEYLNQAEKISETTLVVELKGQPGQEQEEELVQKTIKALKKHGLYSPGRVAFISFSHYMCKRIAALCPEFVNQYLEGDLAPSVLAAEGINGIDYMDSVLEAHPEWVREAHDLGMSVNVWTVNDKDEMLRFIEMGVDAITTNEPLTLRDILGDKEYLK